MKKKSSYTKPAVLLKIQILFLLGLFSVQTAWAQNNTQSLEIKQIFTQKTAGQYLSEVYTIQNKKQPEFTSISAFHQNKNLQTTLFFRIFASNSWQNWQELPEDKETHNTQRTVFGLITVFEKFDKIQFKSEKKVTDVVTFRLFFAANKPKSLKNDTKEILNCNLPSFCDKNCWCPSGNCDFQGTPSTTDVTHIIVHHSATNYPSGTDYAQVVYSFWDYHVNTHGWSDIGYNWLVDPNGILYEGRGDGIRGAHFSCMNSNTMGVCVIGNFETTTPTTETIATLENLIAWEATDKDIDILENAYHPPSQLNLYTISGHKDGNPAPVGCPSGTLCPGTNLYSELVTIRNDIAGFPCYITASIDEITTNKISIYPNPVESIVTIDNLTGFSIQNIYVFNAVGIPLNVVKKESNKLDFSTYSPGIYFVKISFSNTESTIFKILKKSISK